MKRAGDELKPGEVLREDWAGEERWEASARKVGSGAACEWGLSCGPWGKPKKRGWVGSPRGVESERLRVTIRKLGYLFFWVVQAEYIISLDQFFWSLSLDWRPNQE